MITRNTLDEYRSFLIGPGEYEGGKEVPNTYGCGLYGTSTEDNEVTAVERGDGADSQKVLEHVVELELGLRMTPGG